MALASVSLVLLGFVVAVAARSRPGGPDEEALLDFELDVGFDLTRILAWIILILAILGAVLLALGVKEARPRPERKKRNYWALAAAAILLFLVVRYVQPLAAGLFEAGEAVESADAAVEQPPGASGSSAWLFSILLAAIVVAALTRVGLTVRGTDGSFDPPEPPQPATIGWEGRRAPTVLALGHDPRSRVLNAYASFEAASAERGVPRRVTETARRHASRVVRELGASSADTAALIATYSLTRFSRSPITVADAETAELLSAKLSEDLVS
ncbi:MAG: DUF4129 domain-containing protein [Acidimicrobiia bacterium]|nr:DUF4129 domain-containing protein [Acidimicrobiia bacterium]